MQYICTRGHVRPRQGRRWMLVRAILLRVHLLPGTSSPDPTTIHHATAEWEVRLMSDVTHHSPYSMPISVYLSSNVFISIALQVIFTLGTKNLGRHTKRGSGLIVMVRLFRPHRGYAVGRLLTDTCMPITMRNRRLRPCVCDPSGCRRRCLVAAHGGSRRRPYFDRTILRHPVRRIYDHGLLRNVRTCLHIHISVPFHVTFTLLFAPSRAYPRSGVLCPVSLNPESQEGKGPAVVAASSVICALVEHAQVQVLTPMFLVLQWHGHQPGAHRGLPPIHRRRDRPAEGGARWPAAEGETGVRLGQRQEGKPGVRRDCLIGGPHVPPGCASLPVAIPILRALLVRIAVTLDVSPFHSWSLRSYIYYDIDTVAHWLGMLPVSIVEVSCWMRRPPAHNVLLRTYRSVPVNSLTHVLYKLDTRPDQPRDLREKTH